MSKELQKNETRAAGGEALPRKAAQAGCCGGAAPEGADACCALDAEVKATGGAGCGCSPAAASRGTQKGRCC